MTSDPVALTAEYHRLTKHGTVLSRNDYRRFARFQPLDPTNRPAPFKRYRGVEQVELPRALAVSAPDAVSVLSGRDGGSLEEPLDEPLDLSGLARILHLCAGVTRSTPGPSGHRAFFRAAMSAGNLHPLELYAVCGSLEGLGAGVYHFAPLEFGLDRVRSTDERAFLADACATERARSAAASVVITGIPWRTAWKYGERGWRHLYWDAGTLVANLLAAAEAAGLRPRVLTGFVDRDVARLVGVDGTEEFPLAVVELGVTEPTSTTRDATELPPIEVEADRLSSDPVDFPLITEAQRAGVMHSAAAVSGWRSAVRGEMAATEVRGAPRPAGVPIDEVILRRGSTRLMRLEQTPQELLGFGLAVASRDVPGDLAGPERTTLRHFLNVHAVADTTPGSYRWTEEGLEILHAGDHRRQSHHLCLDQPLGGDSAYTVFHTTQLETLFDTHGARGYRVANLEAGVASGRLALTAFALGFGATGLTFRDDEVAAFFDPAVSCLLVTSVGVPDYQNQRGGQPGDVAELHHYEDIMGRLGRALGR